ncbi:hypothetical protein PTSG_11159 [Salpingoeca rosetta]|uniref:N-terminal acetyltransferase B complex subunit NAA25 homolog n=1 Tax=Salpingoeca rosetta (strain ATCC 50818 / BSB-021) TaxID=946362 RepID=F2USL3_SALR5|nr:uncharacterized protein PTSG_11159 [Salpingoeca rosetta]EGD81122.1 hypothetical protein PTSG_11159 [Salpingoeca rosetta]|eukprot:XP_004987807.1 hypothetical protein PTSG_11159 [Salpingoeca rosetta]
MVKPDDVKTSLDEGRNTAALQQATLLLKKDKTNPEAKALKGLALVRLNRDDEADEIVKELRSMTIEDDDSIQTVMMCYREHGAYRDIRNVYETRYKKNPDDLELAAQYFMSMVRVGDLDVLPKVAMDMHRKSKSNTYYFWAVMIQYIQGRTKRAAGDAAGGTIHLTMALRLLERAVDDESFEMSREGLRLYTMVLQEMDKFEDILALLDKDAGAGYGPKRLLPEGREVTQMKINCYKRLNRHADIIATSTPTIQDGSDDWTAYTNVMDAAVALNEAGDSSFTFAQVDGLLSAAFGKATTQDKPQRAPLLACLEWHARMRARGDAAHTPAVPAPLEAFVALFKATGAKRCMFFDTKPYVSLMDDATQRKFLDECSAWMEADGAEEPESKRVLRSSLLALYRRFMGRHHDDDADTDALHRDLVEKFNAAKPCGADLKPSELQYSDTYALLAAHVAVDAFARTDDRAHVDRAIKLLEDAITASSSNPQLRLLIVKLLCLQGRVYEAVPHWEALQVKQIQYDSIGYVFFDHAARLGAYDTALSLLEGAATFTRSCEVDVPEFLCRSFLYGSFHKYEEFVRCQEKLHRSLQLASVVCERFLLNFVRTKFTRARVTSWLQFIVSTLPPPSALDDEKTFSDNSQAEVMDSSDPQARSPTSGDFERMKTARFNYFRVRYLLVQTVASLVLSRQSLAERAEALVDAIARGAVLTAAEEACAAAVASPDQPDLETIHAVIEVLSLVSFTVSIVQEWISGDAVLKQPNGEPVRVNKTVRQTVRALAEAFHAVVVNKDQAMARVQGVLSTAEEAAKTPSYKSSLKAFRAAFKSSNH